MKDLLEEGSVLHCEIGAYITVLGTSRHVTIDQEAGGTGGGWEEAGGGTATGSVDAPG